MQVPDLMPVHPKLDSAEPVRLLLDPRPAPYLALDFLSDARHSWPQLSILVSRLINYIPGAVGVKVRVLVEGKDGEEGGDGDDGDRGGDEDGAGDALDVGIVLFGDYKDVGGDGEGGA